MADYSPFSHNLPETRLRVWPEIANLSRASMEAIWISVWFYGIYAQEISISGPAVWAIFFLITAFTYLFSREMELRGVRTWLRRVWMSAWILASALISLKLILYANLPVSFKDLILSPEQALISQNGRPVAFWVVLLVTIMVLRGVILADSFPDTRTSLIDFQSGLMAFLIYGLIYLIGHPSLSAVGLFAYLLNGLVTMGATRICSVSTYRGGRIPRLGPTWLVGIFAAAAAVVAVGLLLGLVASSKVAHILVQVFTWILAVIATLLFVILWPLLKLLIAFLISAAEGMKNLELFNTLKSLANLFGQVNDKVASAAEKLLPVFEFSRIAVPLAILALLIFAALAWLRLRNLTFKSRPEEDVSVMPPGSLLELIRKLAEEQKQRGFRLISPQRFLAAARIRRIYADLLFLSSRLGAPRKASLTPLEYLPHLDQLFTSQQADLAFITDAYLKVRYGEYPEDAGEVERVAQAWQRVRSLGRKMLLSRRRTEK